MKEEKRRVQLNKWRERRRLIHATAFTKDSPLKIDTPKTAIGCKLKTQTIVASEQ